MSEDRKETVVRDKEAEERTKLIKAEKFGMDEFKASKKRSAEAMKRKAAENLALEKDEEDRRQAEKLLSQKRSAEENQRLAEENQRLAEEKKKENLLE